MAGEFSDNTGSFYRDNTSLLAALLTEHGPSVAFNNAKILAEKTNHDPVDMMREVVAGMMYDSHSRPRVLEYMEWDATVNPDAGYAELLSIEASYYARHNESNEFATATAGIAAVHILSVQQQQGFAPDVSHIKASHEVLGAIEMHGTRQQYIHVLEHVAPHAIAVMRDYVDQGDEFFDEEFTEDNLNELLSIVSGTLYRKNKLLAKRAHKEITDEELQQEAIKSRIENDIIEELLEGNFKKAEKLLRSSESSLLWLWGHLRDKAYEGKDARELVAGAVDTIAAVRPHYFARYEGNSSIDIYFGVPAGTVLGLSNRSYLIKPLLQTDDRLSPLAARYTAMGCAYALGQTNNEAALQEMLQMVEGSEYADVILLNYAEGRKNPLR